MAATTGVATIPDPDWLPRRVGLILALTAAVSLLNVVLAYPLALMVVYGILPTGSAFSYYLMQSVAGLVLWVLVFVLLYSLQIRYSATGRALFLRTPGGIYTVIIFVLLMARAFAPQITWHDTSGETFDPRLIFTALHILISGVSVGVWVWWAALHGPTIRNIVIACAAWIAFDVLMQLRFFALPFISFLISPDDSLAGSRLFFDFPNTAYAAYFTVDPPLWRYGAGMIFGTATSFGRDVIIAVLVGAGVLFLMRARAGAARKS